MRFLLSLLALALLSRADDDGSTNTTTLSPTSANIAPPRPFFAVPTLTQIRDILAQLEAPIVSTLVQRASLPVDHSLYSGGSHSTLTRALSTRESTAASLGRYAYGTLEYPYTQSPVPPDSASHSAAFPPGRFHQDSFSGNANLSTFYTTSLIPALPASPSSYFYSLANASAHATPDATHPDAALALDVLLLQLLSNRAHIGKVVAESKYAAAPSLYAPLISAQNASAIRSLLTNTTQEAAVLAQADAAALALSTAWVSAGETVPSGFQAGIQAAAAVLFRELIDITTEIEIQYLLARFK